MQIINIMKLNLILLFDEVGAAAITLLYGVPPFFLPLPPVHKAQKWTRAHTKSPKTHVKKKTKGRSLIHVGSLILVLVQLAQKLHQNTWRDYVTITSPWGWGTAAPVSPCNIHNQSPNSYCQKKTRQPAGSFRTLKTNSSPATPNMEQVKMQPLWTTPRFTMQEWTTGVTPLTSTGLS